MRGRIARETNARTMAPDTRQPAYMRTLGRMKAFWQFTPVFRREVFKKHGMAFGHFGHRAP